MSVAEYRIEEIPRFLKMLEGIYDRVRLVDPCVCRELTVSDDGTILSGSECFSVWGACGRCSRCVSEEAFECGERRFKEEILDGSLMEIESVPIRILYDKGPARECVLELVNRRRSLEMTVGSIISRYILIYEIDLERDYARAVFETRDEGTFGMVREGNYSLFVEHYSRERMEPELAEWHIRTASIRNLREELKDKDSFGISYTVNYGKWRNVEFRASARREGLPVKALLCFKKVDDDRAEVYRLRREKERQQELLSIALDEARQASLAKTAFLSNMSHDIRTPMNAILGYSALSLDSLDKPALLKEYLENIRVSSRSMLRIVNDVLDVARIESGRTAFNRSSVALEDIAEELRTKFMPEMEKKEQEFSISMKNVSHRILFCDREQFVKTLGNLLQNAVSFTDRKGKISLSVEEKACRTQGYGTYIITLTDTGCGIAPELLPHIYEPFVRGSDNTDDSGNGLGLTIVKKILDLAGGRIEVESLVDEGTTVRVYLDIRYVAGAEARTEPEGTKPGTGSGRKLSGSTFEGRRFLVVDDNRLNNRILMEVLKRLGAEADSAANGREALMRVEEHPEKDYYDALLMDIRMPVMDGMAATAAIRALHDARSRVPIIGVSANTMQEDVARARMAGMNGYLAKPIELEELAAELERVLGQARRKSRA
ncbi:MAG: response regulator [Lachnospiraceae bacterium]|nr:response regulator [Lachnospiraceae bacterium]